MFIKTICTLYCSYWMHSCIKNCIILFACSDMALLDMGADYHGYVSDITCSFPIRGTFSDDQRAVYVGVLNAQRAVMAMIAPGVSWLACHQAAERQILQALVGIGCLVGDDIELLMEDAMGGVFMPHGLGHLIGCDTHDVGGYLEDTPAREVRPGWKSLRTTRLMEANMVMTNEPGCYFIDYLLDQALANPNQARHMNADVLARFRGTGGVRLEDVIAVTDTGVTNLTLCPRTPEEVEAVRAGGAWPPPVDTAPELLRAWAKLVDGGKEMVQYTL
jgi:Xaa-Pro dipeptidase